jgi:hypothetical protein
MRTSKKSKPKVDEGIVARKRDDIGAPAPLNPNPLGGDVEPDFGAAIDDGLAVYGDAIEKASNSIGPIWQGALVLVSVATAVIAHGIPAVLIISTLFAIALGALLTATIVRRAWLRALAMGQHAAIENMRGRLLVAADTYVDRSLDARMKAAEAARDPSEYVMATPFAGSLEAHGFTFLKGARTNDRQGSLRFCVMLTNYHGTQHVAPRDIQNLSVKVIWRAWNGAFDSAAFRIPISVTTECQEYLGVGEHRIHEFDLPPISCAGTMAPTKESCHLSVSGTLRVAKKDGSICDVSIDRCVDIPIFMRFAESATPFASTYLDRMRKSGNSVSNLDFVVTTGSPQIRATLARTFDVTIPMRSERATTEDDAEAAVAESLRQIAEQEKVVTLLRMPSAVLS